MAFPTLGVKDKDNASQTINTLPAAGRAAEAESLSVALSDEDQADVATELALLGSIDTTLATPATSLPHFALDSTSDLTKVALDFTSTSDQTVVSATSGQTTRVHRVRLYIASAVTLSVYDGTSSGTLLEKMVFAGGGVYVLDFDPRPYWITSANSALTFKASAAVNITGVVAYVKSA